jgi:pilus assembly protein CpaF
MRPNRLVLGECRGEEAFDLLQAMNTGHDGSFGTIHANNALAALKRLESLALLTGFAIGENVVRAWIGSAFSAVVHLVKIGDEHRIEEIIELNGFENHVYRFNPVYHHGKIHSEFVEHVWAVKNIF